MPSAKAAGASVLQLFRDGRALRTVMLWVAFFCCLLMVYALASWLPKLMTKAGYGLGSSLSFLLVLNFGAIFGAVGGGWLGDKLNLPRVLMVFFAIAAVSISLLGFKSPTGVLYTLIAIAGATTIGSQILLYALGAHFYEMAIRSTGLGWASGIGRNGAGLNLSLQHIDSLGSPVGLGSQRGLTLPQPNAYIGAGYSSRLGGGAQSEVWRFNADFGLINTNAASTSRLSDVLVGDRSLDDALRSLRMRPVIKVSVGYAF